MHYLIVVVVVIKCQSMPAVVAIAVVRPPSGYSANSALAGTEVGVAWIRRITTIVDILSSVRLTEVGLVEGAVVATAMEAHMAC